MVVPEADAQLHAGVLDRRRHPEPAKIGRR
jgi:hypothetical protein